MNRYKLTDEVKLKWVAIIGEWLNKLKAMTGEEVENSDNEVFTLELSDTDLNPYTLEKVLLELGYESGDRSTNGWQLDFWNYYSNKNMICPALCENICIHGCGMTFELNLSVSEFM